MLILCDQNKALYGVMAIGFSLFLASTLVLHSLGVEINDSVITLNIQTNLSVDKLTRDQHIEVTTLEGFTTLKGTVQSEAAITRAVSIAESTPGIQDVDASQLSVSGSQSNH